MTRVSTLAIVVLTLLAVPVAAEVGDGGHEFDQLLGPRQGASEADQDRSRFCAGGFVSKARLMGVYGLSAAQANAFFASDITLRLGIRGSVRLLNGGQFLFNIRILSD